MPSTSSLITLLSSLHYQPITLHQLTQNHTPMYTPHTTSPSQLRSGRTHTPLSSTPTTPDWPTQHGNHNNSHNTTPLSRTWFPTLKWLRFVKQDIPLIPSSCLALLWQTSELSNKLNFVVRQMDFHIKDSSFLLFSSKCPLSWSFRNMEILCAKVEIANRVWLTVCRCGDQGVERKSETAFNESD